MLPVSRSEPTMPTRQNRLFPVPEMTSLGYYPRYLESIVSPKFTGFSLSLNVTLLRKFRRIRDLRCALEFLNVANSVSGTPSA